MPSPGTPLSPGEVDSLFSGTYHTHTAEQLKALAKAAKPLRYGACIVCGHRQPCLTGFMGDHDWEPGIPADCELREVIRAHRRETGKRIVDVCDNCIRGLLRPTTPAAPQPEQLTLFT